MLYTIRVLICLSQECWKQRDEIPLNGIMHINIYTWGNLVQLIHLLPVVSLEVRGN